MRLPIDITVAYALLGVFLVVVLVVIVGLVYAAL